MPLKLKGAAVPAYSWMSEISGTSANARLICSARAVVASSGVGSGRSMMICISFLSSNGSIFTDTARVKNMAVAASSRTVTVPSIPHIQVGWRSNGLMTRR